MKTKLFFNLFILLGLAAGVNAQSITRKAIKEGIEAYKANKFDEADKSFNKAALQKSKFKNLAEYNKGNALYKSGRYKEATEVYNTLANANNKPSNDPQVFHNLGNTFLKENKYQEAVNAYKQAMKLDSDNEDTRYNLAYALAKLKKENEQKKQNQQNKDKQNQQDQQNQNKDKNKDQKDNKDNKDQEKQNQGDKQNKQGGQSPNKLSKEEAERMLEALNNQEKNLHKKEKKEARRMSIEKDW